MAITYGFFDSINGDRKYSGKQLMEIFDGVISDGVVSGYLNSMAVSRSGSNAIVGSGRAWFKGYWTLNNAAVSLSITAAATTYGRCDAVVIEVNENTRQNSFKYLTGQPNAQYQTYVGAPIPTQSGGVYQYILAYVLVPTTGAGNATIVDQRGNSQNQYSAPYASVYGISDDTYVKRNQGITLASRVVGTDSSGVVKPSDITLAELRTLRNSTENISEAIAALRNTDKGIGNVVSTGAAVASLTLSINDHSGKFIACQNASLLDVIIPNTADANFPVGTEIMIMQFAAGRVKISPSGNISLRAIDGSDERGRAIIQTIGKNAVIGLKKTGGNTWVAVGDYEIVTA